MSDASTLHAHAHRSARQLRSIYQVHYGLQKQKEERVEPLPSMDLAVRAYGLQVAGHTGNDDQKYLGVLKCNNGTILKPIIKEGQKREVELYERLKAADACADLVELRKYTAKYYGCRRFAYNGHEQEYIVLEDLAERMLQPCIMDVKIGKRTWDPLASPEKIAKEQSKYRRCKEEFAFCIPGYQVHRLCTGRLHKYGKDCGKKLHGNMVRGAIKNFLNAVESRVCRALVLQFLSQLWRLQRWAQRQTELRLYGASLLLVYDAARLRECCGDEPTAKSRSSCAAPPLPRRSSIPSVDRPSFSGQLDPKGPVYKPINSVPITAMSLAHTSFSPPKSTWDSTFEQLNHNHSFEHNYEDNVSKIKMNYRAMLDQLSDDTPSNPWGTVRVIDFAHAFFNGDVDRSVDDNFREGIDNLVAIFESILRETDDQVF